MQGTPDCEIVTLFPATWTTAERWVVAVFGATVSVRFDDPVIVPLSVIQLTGLDAAHLQVLALLVTPTVVAPPAAARLALVLLTEKEQGLGACVTATTVLAIVSVAVRGSVVVFAAAEYEALDAPVPLTGVTVSHDAELLAVQAQLAAAFTATVPVPAVAASDSVETAATPGQSASPFCDTAIVVPPALIVAERAAAPVFGSTATVRRFPLRTKETQLTLVVGIQSQLDVLFMATEPPAASNDRLAGVNVGMHDVVVTP